MRESEMFAEIVHLLKERGVFTQEDADEILTTVKRGMLVRRAFGNVIRILKQKQI